MKGGEGDEPPKSIFNIVWAEPGGHAELMLAEARASIDCYEPPGGYMMAFAGMNLGMLRSHTILSVAGGIGASIAAELNIDAEFSGSGAKARGVRGSSRSRGLPGTQTVDMSLPDNSQGGELGAFVGGQLEATVAGQVEWKSPESEKFEPFARIAPAIAGQVGIGGEATLKISYQSGKFRIFARAALCYGAGAKGKLSLEVDATLIYEFAKWVAYQLKNINYEKLDFIEDSAFEALSNITSIAVQFGYDARDLMLETASDINSLAESMWSEIASGLEGANKRAELADRICSDPDLLRYTSPEAKGQIIYQLIQANIADHVDPRNDVWSPLDKAFWKAGSMSSRKKAVIYVFTWVQSKTEFDCIMQRITPEVGGEKINKTSGKKQIQEFLDLGEIDLPIISGLFTDFDGNLDNFYSQLKDNASKGTKIVRNDMSEYLAQKDISPSFYKPCHNSTECLPVSTRKA